MREERADVIAMVASNPVCWELMPQLMEAVRNFCARWGTETSPDVLLATLQHEFVSPAPQMVAIVSYEEGVLTGYTIVALHHWYGTKFVNLLQYWVQRGHARAQELTASYISMIEKWGEAHGATELRCTAFTPALARVYRTYYGFHPREWVVMSKPIRKEN